MSETENEIIKETEQTIEQVVKPVVEEAVNQMVVPAVEKAVVPAVEKAVEKTIKPVVEETIKADVLPAMQNILNAVMVISDASQSQTIDSTKPWFLSKGVIGGVVAAAASIAGLYGMDLDAAELESLLIGVGGIVGSCLAIYGRVTAKTILTKK